MNKIVFKTPSQKALWDEVIRDAIVEGLFSNSKPWNHCHFWRNLSSEVDECKPGRIYSDEICLKTTINWGN